MHLLLQYLLNALSLGAIYSLIALGYTIVYGILQFINFAHGEIMVFGTYIGLLIYLSLEPLAGGLVSLQILFCLIAITGAVLGSASLGVSIEFLAYRPLRNAPRLAPLLSAVGMSILLQNLIAIIWGTKNRNFPMPYPNRTLSFFSSQGNSKQVTVSVHDIVIVSVSIVIMIVLHLCIKKTRWGKSLRATSSDREAAALMGIPVNRIISSAFTVGSALAAVAGVLASMFFTVYPTAGTLFGLKAFIAAVLGGIGSIPGAMLGGLLLGLMESFGSVFLGNYKDVLAFGTLLIMLLLRPAGLLGKRKLEKI